MIHFRSMVGLAATLVLCAMGCSADAGDESVAAAKSAIVNGVVLNEAQVSVNGLVALYHHDEGRLNWFPRPCSATIIKSVAGVSWVLTARHCVTTTNRIRGAQAATSSLRLVAAANPGLASPNPPPGIGPDAVFLPSAPAEDAAHDFALVRANVGWTSRVSSRFGLWVGSPSTLVGVQVTAMGYGVRGDESGCSVFPFPSPGAGTASSGQFFEILRAGASAPTSYTVGTQSTGGQRISCGDSGGPHFAGLGTDDFLWTHLVGVHSTSFGSFAENAMTGNWVQEQLGGLYLSSDKSRNMNLGQSGTSTFLVSAGDPRAPLLRYDPSTQNIRVGSSGTCLARNNANLVQFLNCSTSSSHKWTITLDRQIRNAANSQCLTVSPVNEASLQACSFATLDISLRQHWAFHPQP